MHKTQSYAEWLGDNQTATAEQLRELTDAERHAIDAAFRSVEKRAHAIARHIVRDKTLADDVVQGAIGRIIYTVLRDGARLPATEAEIGQKICGYVRNVALQAIRGPNYVPPEHSFWSEAHAPVSARKVAERPLAADLDDVDDLGDLAVPDDESDPYAPPPRPKHRAPGWPRPHSAVLIKDLIYILDKACGMLPAMQDEVMTCTLEGGRDIVAAVLGISPKTYDTHLARGKASLRKILLGFEWSCPNVDEWGDPIGGEHRSEWNDIFAAMDHRRQARQARNAVRRLAKAA